MSDPPEDRGAEGEAFDPAWSQAKKNAWASAGAKAYRERQATLAAAEAPDFDELTLEEVEARDRKVAKRRQKRKKGGKAKAAAGDGEKPRLHIEKHSPEKTVASLRDILAVVRRAIRNQPKTGANCFWTRHVVRTVKGTRR